MSDEWGTPDWVYDQLCEAYDIHPTIDLAANSMNTMCFHYFDIEDDALSREWNTCSCDFPPEEDLNDDRWLNGPHSLTKQFVIKAHEQWLKHNINILMIIPANSICTKYAEKYIHGSAEYHPIFFRPRFLRDGVPAKDPARNSYFVVIWRKRLQEEGDR